MKKKQSITHCHASPLPPLPIFKSMYLEQGDSQKSWWAQVMLPQACVPSPEWSSVPPLQTALRLLWAPCLVVSLCLCTCCSFALEFQLSLSLPNYASWFLKTPLMCHPLCEFSPTMIPTQVELDPPSSACVRTAVGKNPHLLWCPHWSTHADMHWICGCVRWCTLLKWGWVRQPEASQQRIQGHFLQVFLTKVTTTATSLVRGRTWVISPAFSVWM